MALLAIFLVAYALHFFWWTLCPQAPWLSEKTPSACNLAALNAKYGLDKPVHVPTFHAYLKNILRPGWLWRVQVQKNRAVLDIIVECSRYPTVKSPYPALCIGDHRKCTTWMSRSIRKRGKLTNSIAQSSLRSGYLHTEIMICICSSCNASGVTGMNLFPIIFDASQDQNIYILPCFCI